MPHPIVTVRRLPAMLVLAAAWLAVVVAPAAAAPVSFHTIARAPMSNGGDEPGFVVSRTVRAWHRLWNDRIADGVFTRAGVRKQAPAVDFGRSMVVTVFAGSRPTGGYWLRVDRVVRRGNVLIVRATEHDPGDGCATTMQLTSPFVAVRVPRSPGIVDVRVAVRQAAWCADPDPASMQ